MDLFSRKRAKQPSEQKEGGSKRAKHDPIEGVLTEGTAGLDTPSSSQPYTRSQLDLSDTMPTETGESHMGRVPVCTSPTEEGLPGGAQPTPGALGRGIGTLVAHSKAANTVNESIPGSSMASQSTTSVASNSAARTGSSLPDAAAPARTPNMGQGATLTGWRRWKGFTKPVANVLGPIKELAEGFEQCVDALQMARQAKSEYDELQSRLTALFEDLITYFEGDCPPTMTPCMDNLRESIKDELEYVQSKQGRNRGARYLAAKEDADDILACYRRMEGYLQRLLLNTNLSTWKIAYEQATESRSDRDFSLINRLPSSMPAWYNSAEGAALKRRACTPGTRLDVLATILGWVRNRGEGGVYWLNGMAGTGKTTIAYSVCVALDSGYRLGASFFCSRLREECRNVNLIISSIAYQLARFSRPFQSELCAILEKDPDVKGRRLELQFEALIKRPLLAVKQALPEDLVIVIDALDECDDKDSTQQMLDLLLSDAKGLPIRFIVSSRPEPEIRSQLSERAESRLVLHELDKGEVQADMKKYLREALAPMKPLEAFIEVLAEKAGILFIYAATAVRYIGFKSFKRDPDGRLSTILNGSVGKATSVNKEIDELYSTILEEAFGDSELEEHDKIDMQQILNTVVCAREPLTVNGISELLRIKDVNRVRAALDPMWSVLHVVETSELVTTLHASFPDYMFNPTRSKIRHCDFQTFNLHLAERCFERIEGIQPDFNICGLDSSYLPDERVPGLIKRVDDAISPELLYACRYWADHIKGGNRIRNISKHLLYLLSTRLLLWMEVLSLKKQLKAGMACMKLTVEWCKTLEGEQELMELAQDAKRFVDTFASNPVSQSTSHIYMSMLVFWPKTSPIAKHYAKYTYGPVQTAGTALDRRQLAHLSTWAFTQWIRTMAVSPDGSSIALVIGELEAVVVVDSSSGRQLLQPPRGHTGAVKSIAFSAEGSRIFSGFVDRYDAIIVGWETRSGEIVLGPLQLHGHTDDINCLSFSPDRTCIATGSDDCTVRVWDAENGRTIAVLTAQEEGWVMSVMFSPDGTRIVAGSPDDTLHMWDTRVENTNPVTLTNFERAHGVTFSSDGSCIATYYYSQLSVWNSQSGERVLGPIEAHADFITCIECSPDGRYIVSGSRDRTVRVWDAQTGSIALGPLDVHTGWVTSVAFTSDSSRIISACWDGLVCAWDAQQRNLTPSSSSAPFHRITCAKFSPDSTRFVCGSAEGTISIWDAQTGVTRIRPIKAHTSRINAVDFLNDRVISGAEDGTICVCDAMTGEVLLGPLQSDSGEIRAIAYSPDGQMIATGSNWRVDVWDAQNGDRVLGPLTGLCSDVVSVQFSPDGTRILAGSEAFTSNITVWDTSTGSSVFGIPDGHANLVRSVSYSPNGALIASGSQDRAIIVWDAYTTKKRLGLLTAHSFEVLSVHFSPDSTRLVSGSFDRTIRIWDVETGEMVFELLSGHEDCIMSVEYSPDGTHILSRSTDASVRIHDARSPAERGLSRAESEVGDWTINKDGWVVDNQLRLLVWVPGDLRKALMRSETRVMVAPQGYICLKFDKSRMGESWAEGFLTRI